jgi:hypothetical protein
VAAPARRDSWPGLDRQQRAERERFNLALSLIFFGKEVPSELADSSATLSILLT